ncbi:S-layer homology domain-containing protein [Virgibacillus sp. DJP39]|uniref:S-layer homology domain-containing protein n=1 Tax=Virgibacillus sp. DJP39 TaxID=3409790 RepID=UPI003BB5D4FB
MKRFYKVSVALVLSLSLFLPTIASANDDLTGEYFEPDMRILIEKGILGGYPGGEYLPDRQVTRAEFASLLIRSLAVSTVSSAELSTANNGFPDVDSGEWFYSAVMTAASQQLVGGYPDGTFKPNNKISREEMAAMIWRALEQINIKAVEEPLNFKDTNEINSIFQPSIKRLLFLDIINGKIDASGTLFFAPKANTSRGETAAMLNRMLGVISEQTEKVEKVGTTPYENSFSNVIEIQSNRTPKVDGQGQFVASKELVAYYANSHNFEQGSQEFLQFLLLSQNAGLSPDEINEKVLKGKGTLEGTAEAFIAAGKKYDINEVYLIAHALHETGNGFSKLASGYPVSSVDGEPVTTKKTYNMFGIRAYDDTALKDGSEHAYKQGWFTPETAIIEGAKFIAEGYIAKGQNTLYEMRWNPLNTGYHQYATHVSWAVNQTNRIQNIYNILDSYVMVFDVPEYNNQPSSSPYPTGDDQYAVDTNLSGQVATTTNNLNLRAAPITGYDVLYLIPQATNVPIIGENGGWYKVTTNGKTGWVSGDYLNFNGLLQVVNTPSTLNVRSGTTTSDPIIGSLPKGKFIYGVLDEEKNLIKKDGWYQIKLETTSETGEAQTGWVSGDYIDVIGN